MSMTISLTISANKNRNETQHIYLVATLKGKRKRINIGISVKESEWNNDKKMIVHHPNAPQLNLLLRKHQQKAEKIVFDYEIADKPLSFLTFENEFLSNRIENKSFLQWAKDEMVKCKSDYAVETYRSMNQEIRKLAVYQKTVSFDDLTQDFFRRYERYLKTQLGNGVNTIHKALKTLRTLVNKAIAQKIMKDNPFLNYKIKTQDSQRQHLSLAECERIEEIFETETNEIIIKVAASFLFSCYTGLRYGDMQKLQSKNISNGIIQFKQKKTSKLCTVPLSHRAKNIVDRFGSKHGNVFLLPCNQICNDALKKIALKAGIPKNISFHCGRHTFATISLQLQIPIQVVSKLLGHTKILTTMKYAHIVDLEKCEQMIKWDI